MTEPSRTKAELLERAADLNVEGRSSMTRDELEAAIAVVEAKSPVPDAGALGDVQEDTPVEPGPAARGSLVEVAQKRATDVHLRVVGAGTPDEEA